MTEFQEVCILNQQVWFWAQDLNRRAGHAVFPVLSQEQLRGWLLDVLGGARSVTEILDISALQLPGLDEAHARQEVDGLHEEARSVQNLVAGLYDAHSGLLNNKLTESLYRARYSYLSSEAAGLRSWIAATRELVKTAEALIAAEAARRVELSPNLQQQLDGLLERLELAVECAETSSAYDLCDELLRLLEDGQIDAVQQGLEAVQQAVETACAVELAGLDELLAKYRKH
jgi:hypothetical protein